MDSGMILTMEFRVLPGNDGSFIIKAGYSEPGLIGYVWGFSNVDDLLDFFRKNAASLKTIKIEKGGAA